MFEDLDKKNTLGESFEALVYLIKANPASAIFYCGAAPFSVIWILRNSLPTAFALQAYLVTVGVFIDGPFRTQKQIVNQRWFWKGMLIGGIIVHPLFLIGIWYLDNTYPSFVVGTATLFLLVFITSVIESIIMGKMVDRFRPPKQT